MTTLLDIITVTKDDFEGVTGTIRSTRQLRSIPGIHQIIVDSSATETQQLLQEFIAGEQHLTYIWQQPSGIAPAFNLGLRLSQAEWVWFLNGGDEVCPDIDAEKLLYLVKNSRADAIVFDVEFTPSHTRLEHPPMWAMWPLIPSTWLPHQATLTRRRLYEQYGTFNESFHIAMDVEFWVRCFSKHVIVDTISIPLALFDVTGISRTQRERSMYEVTRLVIMHFWQFVKIWFYKRWLYDMLPKLLRRWVAIFWQKIARNR
ncbi:glycosyltransferase [candidate division KSB3 bacterium]|uniref:Glycosyltransferase n=1 Tax=candidate division KSB3 bacterium TaxID=2044937 RepID=A0A9D5Q4H4_9BACT|nr:glycosyltransferase [candidate division KSB3 bacterium]